MAGEIVKIANEVAEAKDADVILINASMERGTETQFIDACLKVRRRTNAIVLIVTNGGDADVAYRIARCLQQHYTKVTALISGQCKSAGTLLAIGAHELAFSEHGELGPLDVQLRKADDMWANTSGLTVMNAFTALQTRSEEAFEHFALNIKAVTQGSVTFKTAADIATKMTVGLFSHIYQQVEVMHVGEAARAMNIAKEYGQRLDMVTDNLIDGDALSRLIAAYPSHGFVIDAKEAAELFKRVRPLTSKEKELCDILGAIAREQADRLRPVIFLSEPSVIVPNVEGTKPNDTHQTNRAGSEGQEPRAKGTAEQAEPAPATPESPTAEVIKLPTGTGHA
jgi:hypothetical protein